MVDQRSPRSFLYVPGDSTPKLARALERGADAVIIDLEDAVLPGARHDALQEVVAWLASTKGRATPRWVRIEARPDDLGPVRQLLGASVDGLVVPKATRRDLQAVASLLEAERADHVQLAGLVETAEALNDLDGLAATPRLRHLALGEADLAAELGIERGVEDRELDPLRLQLVVASAAARLAPPVASTSTDFRDLDALRASTLRARRLGFRGRTAIHPAQVPIINEVFTPSDDQIAEARDVVERFEAATAAGRGVAEDASGRMIDEATVRSARRVLEYAR